MRRGKLPFQPGGSDAFGQGNAVGCVVMKIVGMAVVVLALVVAVGYPLLSRWMNAGVIRELREEPDGERARKVMLVTLPSGKEIPVNYLRDGGNVYAGADFPWWRELRGEGGKVTVLVQGETLRGHGRAVEDDPALRESVFGRLRPSAPAFTGTLVEVVLEEPAR